MRLPSLLRALVALAMLFVCTAARAQSGPYASGLYREGPGFRLGSAPLVIHPGLSVELGYDSNVFYLPSHEVGSGLLRLRAHLDLATLPPQSFVNDQSTADPKVEFRFSTQVEYREYLSDRQDVRDQRSLNLLAGADLVILPKGLFTLALSDVFARTVDPRNSEGPGNYTRDHNRLGLLGTFHRGGLEVGFGDYFEADFWETDALKFGNSYTEDAQLFAKLRFLPQTIGQIVARAGYVYYLNRPGNTMIPVRVLVGASSLFASWFGATVNLGYGNSINSSGPSFNSALANIEARFFLPKQMRISLGYDRDFHESLFANFFSDDRLSVAYELPLLRNFTVRAEGGVRFRHYEGLIPPQLVGAVAFNTAARDDIIYEAHAEVRYRATSWVQVAVSYNLLGDSTRFGFVVEDVTGRSQIPSHYIKHTALAQADFAY